MNRITRIVLPALLAAGAVLTVAFVAILAQTSAPVAQAQTSTPPPAPDVISSTLRTDIGVSGVGRVSVAPDVAVAMLGVEITAPTLAEATKQSNDRMTAVLAAVKAQGVDAKDIQTSNYNVYPITNQPKEGETPAITGYRVSNLVTIKVRTIANIGQVLDAALAAGANSINNIYFTVNDPTSAQDQARALAVKDAMAKAKTLADAAGVKVGRLFSLSDLSGGVQPVFKGDFGSLPAAAGGAGPVETGQTEITATVEMHFEIE